jgi:hypothetical protein
MNCPRCNSKCLVSKYPAIDKRIYYCLCGSTEEYFRCGTYRDCDLIKFNIERYTIFEEPLAFDYCESVQLPTQLRPAYWTISYPQGDPFTQPTMYMIHREENRISPKQGYKLLQKYRKLLAFS